MLRRSIKNKNKNTQKSDQKQIKPEKIPLTGRRNLFYSQEETKENLNLLNQGVFTGRSVKTNPSNSQSSLQQKDLQNLRRKKHFDLDQDISETAEKIEELKAELQSKFITKSSDSKSRLSTDASLSNFSIRTLSSARSAYSISPAYKEEFKKLREKVLTSQEQFQSLENDPEIVFQQVPQTLRRLQQQSSNEKQIAQEKQRLEEQIKKLQQDNETLKKQQEEQKRQDLKRQADLTQANEQKLKAEESKRKETERENERLKKQLQEVIAKAASDRAQQAAIQAQQVPVQPVQQQQQVQPPVAVAVQQPVKQEEAKQQIQPPPQQVVAPRPAAQKQPEEEKKAPPPQISQQTPQIQPGQAIYTGRLPKEILNRNGLSYLEPNSALTEEHKKLIKAYDEYEKWYNLNEVRLNKESKQNPQFREELDVILLKPINTMTKPPKGSQSQEVAQINSQTAQNIVQVLQSIIQKAQQAGRPDFGKHAVFFVQKSFFSSLLKIQQTTDTHKSMLYEFYVDILDRVNHQIPEICLKEIFIGRCFRAFLALVPQEPRLQDFPNEWEMIQAIGYKKPGTDRSPAIYREGYEETSRRLQKVLRIIFPLMSEERYIGRLFQLLVSSVNYPFHQMSAQILFNLLEITGQRLLRKYGKSLVQ
eukprot:403344198